jgi:FkbM family methyltransferase
MANYFFQKIKIIFFYNLFQKIILKQIFLNNFSKKMFCFLSSNDKKIYLEKLLVTLPDTQKIAITRSNSIIVNARFYPDIKCYVTSQREYVRSQKYFPEEILEWIKTFKDGESFYDIGANIGTYSLIASKFFNGKVKVYSFEPSFTTFVSLMHNVMLNDFEKSLIPFQIAIGSNTQIGQFNYSSLEPGSALNAFNQTTNDYREEFTPVFQQQIICFSLDELIKVFNLPIPTHIKIDVDGTEPDVLRGLYQTLQTRKVKTILIEIIDICENDERTFNIIKSLTDRGFKIEKIFVHTKGRKSEFPRVSDYLFNNANED